MNRRKYPRAALSAFALFLFAAAAMLVSPAASGQKAGRAAEEIGQVLQTFETVTLDPAAVLRSAREGGSVTLQTARGSFDLEVEPYDLRSADYRAVAAGPGGELKELARTPSNSWRGRVRGQEGTVVRLYLDGENLQGIIITPGETFYIEPARDLSSAAGAKEFVFYEASSVKPSDAVCEEMTLGGKVTAQAARSGLKAAAATGSTKPPADEIFGPRLQVEIAAEADFEFFQLNNSNQQATINDIDSIMTQVDAIYEANFGVDVLVLTGTRVWTTSADPYSGTEASAVLQQLTNVYNGSFGPSGTPPARDLVHLFTGRNLDGTTIGIAWTGALCDSPAFSYGLSQSRFTTNQAQRVALTAHEIGHNFGAGHTGPSSNPNDPPQIPGCESSNLSGSIMQPAVTAGTGFCQFSKDEIISHLTGTGGSCLTRLSDGCTYALNTSSQFFPSAGGNGSVGVTSGCAWGVAEGANWITFASEAGAGNGSVGYTVAPNTNSGPREAIVEIGGQKLTVKQAAANGCGGSQINPGASIGGSLTDSDCRSGQGGHVNSPADIYTFTGRAGQRVRIEMLAAVKASDFDDGEPEDVPAAALDAFLYLYGPGGTVVASNDDRSANPNHNTDSAVPISGFLTLPATGVYTIIATAFDDNDNGNYTLNFTDNSAANSVTFSSASYSVSEGTGGDGLGADGVGFRVITVTRSGDVTGTAAVDYATSDGTASRRSDYEQAAGTLVFAPTEQSKSFTVFVPDDAFAEGPETVTLTLSNPAGTTLGTNATATLTINSNDSANGPSPVRAQSFNTAFFVRQQYLDFFSREPDASGFNFWQGEINNCGADEPCREVKRINVSAAFFVSIEFQETGYFVYRTYKAAYGDATSPNVAGTVPVIRLNEFLPDTQRIGQNVIVNVGAWQAQLEANKQAYALEFVLRPRFLATFPLTATSAQFVDQLVLNAGVTLTAAERNTLIAHLDSTADVAAGRAAVLRAVAENQQLKDNEFRRAFVLMQYYGYLRRDPDAAPNTDFTGWSFWLSKLNEFNGNYIQAEMVKAFLTSDEYIDRFGTRP